MILRTPLLADIADGLRSRPGRTAIAMGGVAVGLFALTLTLGILRGFETRARRLTAELGAHAAALSQSPGPRSRDPSRRLAQRHLEVLRASVTGTAWSGVAAGTHPGPDGRRMLRLVRTDADLARVRAWRMARGRFLDPADIRDGTRHAVATESAMHAFGWRPGEAVHVAGHVYLLVGVLSPGDAPSEPATEMIGTDSPALFVPWTAAAPDREPGCLDAVDTLHVSAGDEAGLRMSIAAARRILDGPDLAVPDTCWITPDTLLRGLRRWRAGVAWGTGLLAGLCLAIGGSSLMGLLLSDVRNRVPEIGLRLSLGARPRDIAAVFLGEALLITTLSAAAALLAAWPALSLLARQTAIPFDIDAASVLLVLVAGWTFGAAFSYIPARLAARTPAAAALRND